MKAKKVDSILVGGLTCYTCVAPTNCSDLGLVACTKGRGTATTCGNLKCYSSCDSFSNGYSDSYSNSGSNCNLSCSGYSCPSGVKSGCTWQVISGAGDLGHQDIEEFGCAISYSEPYICAQQRTLKCCNCVHPWGTVCEWTKK